MFNDSTDSYHTSLEGQQSPEDGHTNLADRRLRVQEADFKVAAEQVVSLNSIVMAARDALRSEVEDRNIVWRPVELGEAVCDPEQMKQVFVNLFSNAIRYTRQRAPAVIQVGAFVLKGEQVVFVRDNGTGFDKHHDENEATGTGFATAARNIRKQGGRAWANADVASGATFYFTVRTPGPVQCTVPNRPAGL